MQRVLMCSMGLLLFACGKKDSSPASGSTSGSSVAAKSAESAGSAAASPSSDPAPPPPPSNIEEAEALAREQVAQMVVKDVGSKALGSQTIDAACVSVVLMPAGDWTVAAARLNECGDKTARSILWLYKRKHEGKWNEDYVGQPPKCWKGVPPDISVAVTKATKIPSC